MLTHAVLPPPSPSRPSRVRCRLRRLDRLPKPAAASARGVDVSHRRPRALVACPGRRLRRRAVAAAAVSRPAHGADRGQGRRDPMSTPPRPRAREPRPSAEREAWKSVRRPTPTRDRRSRVGRQSLVGGTRLRQAHRPPPQETRPRAARLGSRCSARLVDGLEEGHRAAALPLLLERRLADPRAEVVEVRRRVGPSDLERAGRARARGAAPRGRTAGSRAPAARPRRRASPTSRARSRVAADGRSRVRSRAPRRAACAPSRRRRPRARGTRGWRESARRPRRRPGLGGWPGSRRTVAGRGRDRRA